VRCPFRAGQFCRQNRLLTQFGEFVTRRALFRYRKLYAGIHLAMAPCECSKGEACCPISTGRPPICCSLIIPHPLGLEIGPQTTRENFRLPVFLWSLGWLVYSAAFAAEGLPVFQAIWIARQACARRTSQLVFRRVSVVTCATLFRSSGLLPCMISALDSSRMVRHAWTCRTTPSLNSWFRANPDSVPAEPPWSIAAFFPAFPGWVRLTDSRKTRFDLRRALDCDFLTVTSRTLSQSARTTRSFELLLACSFSGTSDLLQSRFPARLQPATGLRRKLRQGGCDAKALNCACAPHRNLRTQCWSLPRAEPLRRRFGCPLALPAWSAACAGLHASGLRNSPAFADSFSQVKAVKLQPMLSPLGSSDIESLRSRSSWHRLRNLLNCACDAVPLASGIRQLFAAWSLHPATT